ncbi:hypothetical protein STPYR_11660 [uncultured Stenotrophomonas sp.]|uniref:Transposase n=1 Tax=uncultured Stenotrophomonas sp. TaxID=165438 RepID=A0A1Y5Q3A5_9GAMM|nr:hypothetical protein STPYR_11660 [uncultured Stenotrophomonas sp.]
MPENLLTDAKVRSAKPTDRDWKLSDGGGFTEAMMIAVQDDPAATTLRPSRPRWPLPSRVTRRWAELAQQFDLHPNQITQWRSPLLENATGVFGAAESSPPRVDVKALPAKIGELTLENDF